MSGFANWATTSAVAVAVGLGVAGPAQAGALIDDFNFTVGAALDDTSADGAGLLLTSRGTGGYVAPGWARDSIYANLVAGDRVVQADCANCDEGHFNSGANATGNGYESWRSTGGLRDLGNSTWSLDYGLDVSGFDVVMYFFNSSTNAITGEIWWKDIAATTPVTGTPGRLNGSIGAGVQADYVFIEEFSVGGLYNPNSANNYGGHLGLRDFGAAAPDADFSKDNLRGVPEPATWALVGLGLAALGLSRRRAG